MKLVKVRGRQVIADRVEIADGFAGRLVGLIGKEKDLEGVALMLKPCNSIHTFFMRTPIDVVFLDRLGMVIYSIEEMRPFKFSGIIKGARTVVELSPGAISENDIRIFDILKTIGD
ncbi:MAG: DUF192 domain-containing protein [Bacillota bacterium]